MRIEHIRQRLQALGAKSCHEERILRAWTQARPLDHGARRSRPEDFLPMPVREALPALAADLDSLARVSSEHPGEDGSALSWCGLPTARRWKACCFPGTASASLPKWAAPLAASSA